MTFLSIVLLIGLYSFACLGTGLLLLKLLAWKNTESAIGAGVRLATAYLLGQGILANIWLILALYGQFIATIVISVTLALAACGVALARKDLAKFWNGLTEAWLDAQGFTLAWKIIAGLTVLLCLAWITSIGRSPFGDGSSFYLAIAKVIAESHRLRPLPGYEDLSSIGLQGELHFAALMQMGSPGAAQLFPWTILVAGAIVLWKLAAHVGLGRHGRWLVLGMLFSSSAVTELSGSGKIDLSAAALGLATYYWATQIRLRPGFRTFLLIGLLAGLTLIAKISYVLSFIPSLGIILAWAYLTSARESGKRIFSLRETMPLAVLLVAGFTIAIGPHLIKNFVLFNNALAPLGSASTGWQDQSWNGPETTRRVISALPLSLTFGDYWAQFGNLSPLVLGLLPCLLLLPRPRQPFKSELFVIGLAALAGTAGWFIFRPSVFAPRYLLACLLLLLLPAARAGEYLALGRSKFFEMAITTFTILVLISSGLSSMSKIFYPKETLLYFTGKMTECAKAGRFCAGVSDINRLVGPGDRIFADTLLRYWLRADLIQCGITESELDAYRELETPDQRWSFIYGRGFRFLPIIDLGTKFQHTVIDDLDHIPAWLVVTRLTNDKNYLMELKSVDPNHRPLIKCGQVRPPSWELFDLDF